MTDDQKRQNEHFLHTLNSKEGASWEQSIAIAALLRGTLNSALSAIDALIDKKPMLAATVLGSTTLGNLRAEIKAVLHRVQEATRSLDRPPGGTKKLCP